MKNNKKIELLAPAGSVDAFWAAVESGADAVYIGIRKWNARVFARNFSIRESKDLIRWAHKKGVKVYLTINSLFKSEDINQIVKALYQLSEVNPDGLIVQDLGLLYVVKQLLPGLPVHVSTLAGIYNLGGVEAAAKCGAKRVVLARELSIDEVVNIAKKAPIDIEVFVHGALCFSYSGLCMASSFRGGRSGLEGKCAQPCRLEFKQGKSSGYFLSCSDFVGIKYVPKLKRSPVAALKIEGRMKSADFVASVVKAYKMVIDAENPDDEKEMIKRAEEILAEIPSRRQCRGYWSENPSQEILTPHRSGTSGKWIGTVKRKLDDKNSILVAVRTKIKKGDRIRPESSRNREEPIFEVKRLFKETGEEVCEAHKGENIILKHVPDIPSGTRLFKIGTAFLRERDAWKLIKKDIKENNYYKNARNYPGVLPTTLISDRKEQIRKVGKTLIIKVGSVQELPAALNSPAKWVILKATISNLKDLSNTRLIKPQKDRIVLSLPSPFVADDTWKSAIKWFVERGFRIWEVNNLSHFHIIEQALDKRERIGIVGGPRLNVKNPYTMEFLAQMGCNWITLSPELSRKELLEISRSPLPTVPIVLVYHWMPIMVSALKPKMMERKVFRSKMGDGYYYKRSGPYSLIFADRPVSWLDKIPELEKMGYRLFEIDISEGPWSLRKELSRLLSGYKRFRSDKPFSEFNWGR